MYELKVGDIIKIKTGGKIREVTITDIMLEAFIESEGRLDWKTTIRFKYGKNPPYISDKLFANSFIEAYNNAVSEMNSILQQHTSDSSPFCSVSGKTSHSGTERRKSRCKLKWR